AMSDVAMPDGPGPLWFEPGVGEATPSARGLGGRGSRSPASAGGLEDLAGVQTAGADEQVRHPTLDQRTDLLEVRIPHAPRGVVCVADVVPVELALAADITPLSQCSTS